jgi:hypothetical protein
MRSIIYWSMLACFLITSILGASQTEGKPTIVNLMIVTDAPASTVPGHENISGSNLLNLYREIDGRNLIATVFSTQEFINTPSRLILTQIGFSSDFELAMSGNNTGEKLSTKSYAGQKAILETSKRYVEACKICGKNEIAVNGFMPQSFAQNKDTYKALDDLLIKYDAGFQAGILYAPGHENAVWPYLVEGHKFYAVPVSTYSQSGKKVVLQDSFFNNPPLGASEWYDALASKFDEIQGKDEPMVISLTTTVSGSGDYFDALKRFMDYATSKKASFVTTNQLVDMTKAGVRNVSELPAANESGECLTCDQSNSNANITISTDNTTQTAASDAETATS